MKLRREFEGRIRDKTATRICRDCQWVEEPKNIPAGITFLSFSEAFIVDRISALQSRVSSQRVKVASCGIGMELLVWEGWRDEMRSYGGMRDWRRLCWRKWKSVCYISEMRITGSYLSEGCVSRSVGCEYFPFSIQYTVPVFGLQKCFRPFYA